MLQTQQKTSPRGRGQVEPFSELLQRFIEHLRSHDRSERTVKSYSSDLNLFAKWFYDANREELTPKSMTPIDLREYRRYLLQDRGFKPATVNRRLASISAFCKWALEQGLVPGFSVNAVDTTAAGDAFNGGLAVALAEGRPLVGAVRFANACGALATTRLGAQPSLPTVDEVEAFLVERGGQ